MNDLVERLRTIAPSDMEAVEQAMDEAADRIEALIDDVAHEKEYLAEAEDLISQHYERAIKAEKRVNELEAALREIVAIDAETDKENRWDFPSLLGRAQDIAKRILGIETLAETIARRALESSK